MPVKKRKPTNPASRQQSYPEDTGITRSNPEKALIEGKSGSGGRNNKGRITVRFRGGGHKRRYRIVDFKRDKHGVPAKVAAIEYDPNRSAHIALLHYVDGEKRYILWPGGLEVGGTVVSGEDVPVDLGNALPIRKIPLGTVVHNVELRIGKGGQMVRSAGTGGGGEGRQVRSTPPAFRRGPAGACGVLRYDRTGRQRRAREHLSREGRPQATPRVAAPQSGRDDESRGSPDGWRRGPVFRRSPSHDSLGQAHQGLQDPSDQANSEDDRPVETPAQVVGRRG